MIDLLTTIAIIFTAAGPFLLIANRLGLPPVPLLIVAGLVAGLFIDEARALELAQYGIALLVFSFGIGIQIDVVRTVLADSEMAALGQILGVGSLATGSGLAIGIPIEESIYLGAAAAFSSTIVGTTLLKKEIRSNLVHGRVAESIQLVQDLIALLLLLVLGAEALAADPIATQLGYGLMLLLGAVLVKRYVFDLLGRLAGGSAELMIIGAVSVLVVFIGAAEGADVSVVVGAFAAGLAVRHDADEHLDLYNGIESIKDFFVAIFFVTIGALVALPTLETVLIAAGLVVLTAIVKPAITMAILISQGYEPRSAVLTSLSIDQVSEFALIIAIEASILGYLTPSVFDAIILAAALTMITSSISTRYNEAIYRVLSDRGWLPARYGKIDAWSQVPSDITDHVIIAGYGRQGRQLVETCEEIDQPYVVIENDPAVRDTVQAECDAYVFGDAMEAYSWQKANVDAARLVISTIPFEPVSRRLLASSFEADLILRTDTVTSALQLLEEDVLYVVVTDLLAGEQLVQYVQALLDGRLTPAELRAQRVAELEPGNDPRRERTRSDGDPQAMTGEVQRS
ncbi:MAG: potassium transporter Kef [Bacteroidetes bacterium]|jgi:CPA2 family monovalent cation:H+ antiporter-2|nr:potassium transporter Kef [Bacteroidota bacterium]